MFLVKKKHRRFIFGGCKFSLLRVVEAFDLLEERKIRLGISSVCNLYRCILRCNLAKPIYKLRYYILQELNKNVLVYFQRP